MLLERYAAQVRAFEDLQTTKSSLQQELETMRNSLHHTAAESAVAAATRELEQVQARLTGSDQNSPKSPSQRRILTGSGADSRVGTWLHQHDLGEYENLFAANEIDFETCSGCIINNT